MAYCPKCGVEVDNNVKNCPLCDFPIPDIGEEPKGEKRYPLAVNTYPQEHQEKKNRIFYALEIIVAAVFLINMVLYWFIPFNPTITQIIMISSVSLALYLMFCFNYLPVLVNLLGCYFTTLLLGSIIYVIVGGSGDWFVNYAMPIVTILFIDILIFGIIYKKNRHRNQFIYAPVFLIAFSATLCLGIDGVISYNILGHLRFTWSLIVAISGICIIALLMGIYHGVPDRTKAYLKKKLHV